jgi:hypothetical protein
VARLPGLEIVQGDALGNAQRAELFEYRAAAASSAAGRPRRVGDDAADRERREPAGA